MSAVAVIDYTLFRNVTPGPKDAEAFATVPWTEVVKRAEQPAVYRSKFECPLISLATYGGSLSQKGCVRHAANVRRVHGVEGDYDGGVMPIEEAAQLLQAADIESILYTSPSNTLAKPRWRVLAPFAQPHKPEERALFVAQLNRVLDGGLARESFALSQSFFIGRVTGTEYRAVQTHGRTIDQCTEIEPQYFVDAQYPDDEKFDQITDEELRAAFSRGDGRWTAMLKLSSRWAARGMQADDIEGTLNALLDESPNGTRNADGVDLRTRVRALAESAVKKYGESRKAKTNLADEDFAGAHPDIVDELRTLPRDLIVLPNDYVPTPIAARRIFDIMGKNRELFARHGRAVEIEESALSLLSAQALRSRLDSCGRRVKTVVKKDDALVLVYKRCSASNAEMLLESREVRSHLPPIELVTDAPLLVESEGEVLVLGRGYNAVCGGVMVLRGKVPEIVPLEVAVASLLNLVEDFRFTEPADKSRGVAGYVGPCLRMGGFVYGHALMNAVEADQSQTGKDYLLATQRACYGGSVYVISRREGGVGSPDESTAQGFASGRPFLYYENVRGRMASEYLEGAMTSFDPIPVRLPHKGEFTVNARHVTFQLSSNGVEAIQDLANRVLITRLLKQPRGYQFKQYPERGLLQHIQTRQPFYAGCIFAVVKAWHAAGKPTLPTRHSFADWVGSLDWIVQRLFGLPPLLDGHDSAVVRIANPALSWLRTVALAVIAEGKTGRRFPTNALLEIAQSIDAPVPRARADMPDDAQHRLIGTHMAKCFREGDTLLLDAVSVRRYSTEEYSSQRQRTEKVNRYKFWTGADEPPDVDGQEGDF